MTDDERQLLLELTGTVKIILQGRAKQWILRDFEELVMPLYARVFDTTKITPVQS